MQVSRGSAWDRTVTDLCALAGRDHREPLVPLFSLSVEHLHTACPPCWPVARRRVIDADARELAALIARIGGDVRAAYTPRSRTGGLKALAARFGITRERVTVVLEQLQTA